MPGFVWIGYFLCRTTYARNWCAQSDGRHSEQYLHHVICQFPEAGGHCDDPGVPGSLVCNEQLATAFCLQDQPGVVDICNSRFAGHCYRHANGELSERENSADESCKEFESGVGLN